MVKVFVDDGADVVTVIVLVSLLFVLVSKVFTILAGLPLKLIVVIQPL